MIELYHDLRQAVRALARRPGFAAVALLTLAVGIGANVAIFTVVDAALLRPLPYASPERLVHLWETQISDVDSRSEASYPDYLDWVARNTAFAGLGGYQRARFVMVQGDRPDQLNGAKVTANFFDVLGVKPVAGRSFQKGEDQEGAGAVAMISYSLWQNRFVGDRDIVGRTISVDAAPVTVVGVLPQDFQFAATGVADIWIPLDSRVPSRTSRGLHWLNIVGRLGDGVTMEQARGNMSAIMHQLALEYPPTNAKRDIQVVPLRDELTGSVQPVLLVLFVTVGLVLLIACANVANLLLVRGAGRSRELAIRAALGAGRARLARLMMVEAGVLSAVGCALGLALAPLAVRLLLSAIPAQRLRTMPYLTDLGVDVRVTAYAIVIALVAALLFGLGPALRMTRPDLNRMVKDAGQRGSSARSVARDGLVIAEIALTLVLVSAAMLLTRSLGKVLAVDPGFQPVGVMSMTVRTSPTRYPDGASRTAFFDRLVRRLDALPGVEGVGLSTKLPLDFGNSAGFRVVGQPAPPPGQGPGASIRSVNEDYFATLAIPIVQGRVFRPGDDAEAPLRVVVNRTLERDLFSGESAIGHQLDFGRDQIATIVGVVGDVTIGKLEDVIPPTLYMSFRQRPSGGFGVVVSTSGDPTALTASIRAAVHDLDPEIPVVNLQPMTQLISSSTSVFLRRYPMLLVGAFAVIALVLAIIGIYGVISYSVAQRTRELGIRIALGATRANIGRAVLKHGALLALGGVAVGIPASIALGRFLSSLLYGVRPSDPLTLATVALLLGAVTLVATYLPARRATTVDPMVAMRAE